MAMKRNFIAGVTSYLACSYIFLCLTFSNKVDRSKNRLQRERKRKGIEEEERSMYVLP